MSSADIESELQNDPQGLGYAALLAEGRDNAVADLLNAKTIAARRFVLVRDELLPWLGNSGVRVAMEFAAFNPATAENWELRAALSATEKLLAEHQWIDLDGAVAQQMVGMFRLAGIITEEQEAALMALADTHISRAEQLWGVGAAVSTDQVSEALRG